MTEGQCSRRQGTSDEAGGNEASSIAQFGSDGVSRDGELSSDATTHPGKLGIAVAVVILRFVEEA